MQTTSTRLPRLHFLAEPAAAFASSDEPARPPAATAIAPGASHDFLILTARPDLSPGDWDQAPSAVR